MYKTLEAEIIHEHVLIQMLKYHEVTLMSSS